MRKKIPGALFFVGGTAGGLVAVAEDLSIDGAMIIGAAGGLVFGVAIMALIPNPEKMAE
ncbi:MAG: hypothetical protein ACOCYP_02665 [Planctomycetota bacterium]